MKTKKESTSPTIRNKYTAQFKEQALERADCDGIPKAAKDLGLANRYCIIGKPNVAKPVSHLR